MAEASEANVVRSERTGPDGRIGELVLNRPERRNALTSESITALHDGLEAFNADSEVGVILIRGEGGAFCAGNDLKEPRASDHGDRWRRFHAAMYASPKPTVGALERFGIAAGSALALACDFIVAGETGYIHTSEVRFGAPAPVNTVWLELKHNLATAYRMAVAGAPVLGPELVQLGLAVKSVPDDRVVEEARGYATLLLENDGDAMAKVKRAVQHLHGVEGAAGFEERLRFAQRVNSGD